MSEEPVDVMKLRDDPWGGQGHILGSCGCWGTFHTCTDEGRERLRAMEAERARDGVLQRIEAKLDARPTDDLALVQILQHIVGALERMELGGAEERRYLRKQHERIGEAVQVSAEGLRDLATAMRLFNQRMDELEAGLRKRGSL